MKSELTFRKYPKELSAVGARHSTQRKQDWNWNAKWKTSCSLATKLTGNTVLNYCCNENVPSRWHSEDDWDNGKQQQMAMLWCDNDEWCGHRKHKHRHMHCCHTNNCNCKCYFIQVDDVLIDKVALQPQQNASDQRQTCLRIIKMHNSLSLCISRQCYLTLNTLTTHSHSYILAHEIRVIVVVAIVARKSKCNPAKVNFINFTCNQNASYCFFVSNSAIKISLFMC